MIISPDPKTEDTLKDLDLRELMDQTMLALQEKFPRQQIEYFAAIHADHTDKRHVHVVALLRGKLTRSHLGALRSAATNEATAQRQRLDQERGLTPAISQQPTRRDRPTPVFVSREPRHVDREVSKLPAYGGSSPKTQWKQAKPERLKLQQTLCPLCGGNTQMVRLGSRFVCLYCGLSVQAERHVSKSKEPELSRERSLEEVGMS
jgi:ribosomal protein S27AE